MNLQKLFLLFFLTEQKKPITSQSIFLDYESLYSPHDLLMLLSKTNKRAKKLKRRAASILLLHFFFYLSHYFRWINISYISYILF